MKRYEKLRVGRQVFILRVESETDFLVAGIQVNEHGEEIASKGFDDRLRIVDKSLITSRTTLRWNNLYATLEP